MRARERALAIAALGGVIGAVGMWNPVIGTGQTGPEDPVQQLGNLRFKGVKGRAFVFGTFTPGQVESIAVRKMPKRAKLVVEILPAGAPGGCSGPFVCIPARAKRAPGTRRFRTSGRGRALLFITMPTHYERFRLDNLKAPNVQVPFVDDQRLLIQLGGGSRRGNTITLGFAVARTTVEIPQAPSG